MFHLSVTDAFPGFERGDRITDAAEIEMILSGPNEGNVVRVAPAILTEE